VVNIDPNRIDLWLTFLDDVRDARLLDAYRRLLNAEEVRRAQRFLRAQDRRRYLITRALVRTVLSRYAGVPPRQLSFTENPHGKPALVGTDPRIDGPAFNLSHCEGVIVLALAHRRALGVDVEKTAAQPAPVHIAERYFATEEAAQLRALPGEMQQQRFYEYWTLKEAYIKACGKGLSIPLDRFGFRFDTGQGVNMWMQPELGDYPSRWSYWQIGVAPDYLIALCAEHDQSMPSPHLTMTRTIPLGDDQDMTHVLLRTSSAPHRAASHG
jgi:4'-phosphopantetheinyl transferase